MKIQHMTSTTIAMGLWVLASVSMGGCLIDESHFGLSDQNLIVDFEIDGQSDTAVIDQDVMTVEVPMPAEVDLTALTPTTITVSSLAVVSPEANETQDFSSPVTYVVTAEDGATADYSVTVVVPE